MSSSTEVVEPARRAIGLQSFSFRRFLFAFVFAAAAVLLLAVALVLGMQRAYDGKVLPGVRVGNVDVAGLTRDEARAKLATAYARLGEGQITVTTPSGEVIIKYADIGRQADVEAMADEALAFGRSGDTVSQAMEMAGSAVRGNELPVLVKLDPTALAYRLHALGSTAGTAPQNAKVDASLIPFKAVPAVIGQSLDEVGVGNKIVNELAGVNAPDSIAVTIGYIAQPPQISTEQASFAATSAEQMVADVTLTFGDKKFTLKAETVRKTISFGIRSDGTYGAVIDSTPIKNWLQSIAPSINVDPVDPTFLLGRNGKPVGVTGGKDGVSLNVDTTTQAVVDYLTTRAIGPAPAALAVTTDAVKPKMSDVAMQQMLPQMVRLSYWTVQFFPGEANCNGKNIRQPAANINGTVVPAGQIFSFWNSVGPVDEAHGFCAGGVIVNGRSDHTGAMGGGICSASTTMFNAAARAGLDILERHPHYYYIDRYPIGLDATVFMDGGTVWDMRWRNDTNYPILVLGYSTYNTVTFELWSVPTGRTVAFNGENPYNFVYAKDGVEYTTKLAPGQQYRAEYPTNGFDIVRTRVVKDSGGNVIHSDTWSSHYSKVDGVLQIGTAAATPPPAPKPTPPPATTKPPAATPPPSSGVLLLPLTLLPLGRRRRGKRRQ